MRIHRVRASQLSVQRYTAIAVRDARAREAFVGLYKPLERGMMPMYLTPGSVVWSYRPRRTTARRAIGASEARSLIIGGLRFISPHPPGFPNDTQKGRHGSYFFLALLSPLSSLFVRAQVPPHYAQNVCTFRLYVFPRALCTPSFETPRREKKNVSSR